jgi:hypothetical protein
MLPPLYVQFVARGGVEVHRHYIDTTHAHAYTHASIQVDTSVEHGVGT